MTFQLISDSFADGDYLAADHLLSEPFGFGCGGGNISPALSWSGAPAATRSFAVTCFDPDAPTGSGFWHWILVNLASDVSGLRAGVGTDRSIPDGSRHVVNDFGTDGYGGPCPPPGDHPHRYLFTVHALGVDPLPIADDTPSAVARFQINANSLGTASLMGLCRR
jgi:Raf kinase inhibitor-like YbhB/YbcL family protein